MSVFAAAPVDFETLVGRTRPGATEMPFSGKKGTVAVFPERLGESKLLRGHPVFKICRIEFAVAAAREIIGCTGAGGILAGKDAPPSRRTNRRGGVKVGEDHPARSEVIEVGGLVKGLGIVESH